jgi:hypothetical protein
MKAVRTPPLPKPSDGMVLISVVRFSPQLRTW